ncbi:hypothetical protein, partial [Salinibacter ruber]|uniref:hypothetical protein n=1 Tax=Salinibacter ruber TaxID=146919 RepID=UPI002167EB9A
GEVVHRGKQVARSSVLGLLPLKVHEYCSQLVSFAASFVARSVLLSIYPVAQMYSSEEWLCKRK